jgi:general secretion pathway protein G
MNENLSPDDSKSNDVHGKMNWVGVMCLILLAIVLVCIVRQRFRVGRPARFTAASAQIAVLGAALGAYCIDNGHYPRGSNGLMDLIRRPPDATNWHGPYLVGPIPEDPWRQPYTYKCPGQHNPQSYDLSSKAPDGQVICNWKQE